MEFYEDDPPTVENNDESASDLEGREQDPSSSWTMSPESSPRRQHSCSQSRSEQRKRTPGSSKEHSVHDDLSKAVEYLYRNYTRCRSCNSTDIEKVIDQQDDNVLMVWCHFCSYTFGVDDSMSPEVVLDLYKQGHIEVNIGCCTNTDPNQFKIEGFDGSDFVVRCLKCHSYGVLGDQRSTGSCKNPAKDQLVCACGNRDQGDMTVCVFGDEVRCVICKVCEAFVHLPRLAGTTPETSDASDTPDTPDTLHPSEFISCECPPGEKNITITRDANGEPEIIACANCGLYYLPQNSMRSNSSSEFISCECPPEKKNITITRDANGEPEMIACATCQLYYLPKSPMRSKSSQKRPRSQGRASGYKSKFPKDHANPSKLSDPPKYREVQRITDLHRGDHILWDRWLGYGHHAIVEDVHPERGKVTVWHYNGPSPSVTDKVKGQIVKQELDPFEEKHETLYVADYSNPFPPDEVIRRAESREGEVKYSLVSNNCEHFATWCKTGQHFSAQVTSVQDCFTKYYKACTQLSLLRPFSKTLARYGAVALLAPVEVFSCVHDVYQATEDRAQGKLSRDTYVELTVSRVFQGLGGLAGMALGMLVPIPYIGELIGGTVGGMIGSFIGNRLGSFAVKAAKEIGTAFGIW